MDYIISNQKSISVKLQRLLMIMVAIIVASMTITACLEDENGENGENSTTVDKDGLTKEIRNIVTDEYLAKFKAIGLEINGGNKPPNIEGKYLSSPNICIKSSFPSDFYIGLQTIDAEITFSEQDNAKLTVLTYFDQSGLQTGKGTGSFITGSGNKFTVFVKTIGTLFELPIETIDIYSGELSSSGIKNYHNAQMVTKGNIYTNIPEGEVRLFKDNDGLAERIK